MILCRFSNVTRSMVRIVRGIHYGEEFRPELAGEHDGFAATMQRVKTGRPERHELRSQHPVLDEGARGFPRADNGDDSCKEFLELKLERCRSRRTPLPGLDPVRAAVLGTRTRVVGIFARPTGIQRDQGERGPGGERAPRSYQKPPAAPVAEPFVGRTDGLDAAFESRNVRAVVAHGRPASWNIVPPGLSVRLCS